MSIDNLSFLDRRNLRPRSVFLLYITAHAIRSRIEQELRRLKLTGLHYSILSMVQSNGSMSSAELSRRFYVTPQTMNGTILTLERRGLLERHPAPTNARIRCIDLTPKGSAVVEECDAMVDVIEEEAFSSLDDLELAMLRRLTFRVFEGQKSRA
ncbi:DNA-binding MarR family transcriptional regulator [Amorphus suaedae]